MQKLRILVVDDEAIIRDFFARFFRLKDAHVVLADTGREAIVSAKKEKFDIAFLDVRMQEMNGVEVLKELKKINPGCKYIMMTGYAVDDLLEAAKKEGAAASLKKPFDMDELNTILADYVK